MTVRFFLKAQKLSCERPLPDTIDSLESLIYDQTSKWQQGRPHLKAYLREEQKYLMLGTVQTYSKLRSKLLTSSILIEYLYLHKEHQNSSIISCLAPLLQNKHLGLQEVYRNEENMGKEIFLHRLNTSTRLYSQKEGDMQKVTIRYAVSSPLVEHRGKETIPLFNEEICLSKQYERLQKVSNSLHGLQITVDTLQSTQQALRKWFQKLSLQKQSAGCNILQIFAQVIFLNNKPYISLESEDDMGRRDLVDVMNLFKNAPISLLIVIGVKAALLVKVELGIPGVFVSTHCYETDHNATVFLDNLYEGLLQKKSVKEAFEKSKAEFDLSIDKNNDNMCCCLHEHKPECNWHDIASTIGHSLAHRAFKHSSIESNDSQLKCKIQTSFLMAIGHNDSMNHCINQENLCCQEKSIHWKGKQRVTWNRLNYDYKEQSSEEKPNKLVKKDTFNESFPFCNLPLTLYNLVHDILRHKRIVMVQKKKVVHHGQNDLLLAGCKYITARDLQIVYEQVVEQDGLREWLQKKLQQLQGKAKKLIVVYSGRKYGAEDLEKIQKNMVDIENTNKTEVILLIKIGSAEVDYLQVIKLTEVTNYRQKIFLGLSGLQFKYGHREVRKELQKINDVIKESLVNEKEVSNDNLREMPSQVCNMIAFIKSFPNGFYLTSLTQSVLQAMFGVNSVYKLIHDKDLPLQAIQKGKGEVYLKLDESKLDSSKQFLPQQKAEYCYLILRLIWRNFIRTFSNEKQFGVAVNQYFNRGELFTIDLDQVDCKIRAQVIDKCQQIQQDDNIVASFLALESATHHFHYQLVKQLLTTRLGCSRHSVRTRKKSVHSNQLNSSSSSTSGEVQQCQTTSGINQSLLYYIAVRACMLYQANDSLKEKFNSLKPKLKYFIQSMYACSFAAQVCQLQLSSLLGESIRNSSRKDFKYCWYTQLISLLRNYEQRKRDENIQIEDTVKNIEHKINVSTSCTVLYMKIRDQISKNKEHFGSMMQQFCARWYEEMLGIILKRVIYLHRNWLWMTEPQRKSSFKHRVGELKYCRHFLESKKGQIEHLNNSQLKADTELCLKYLQKEIGGKELDQVQLRNWLTGLDGKISALYKPIFKQFQGMDRNLPINETNLIVFSRSRCLLLMGKPYMFVRKRNMALTYFRKIFQQRDAKLTYFTLTLEKLAKAVDQMIYLVLSFDCINHNDSVSVVFEKHNQITEELIPLSCLVDIISKLKVEFLVLVGKDSQLVGKYLSTNSSASKRKKPLVILTVESEFYALKNYLSQQRGIRALEEYLRMEIYQMCVDMLIISILKETSSGEGGQKVKLMTETQLDQIVLNAKKIVEDSVVVYPEIVATVIREINHTIFLSSQVVELTVIGKGRLQDLTAKVTPCPQNLVDQQYYENIGRCKDIEKVLDKLNKPIRSVVSIVGDKLTGKSSMLHELCWLCHTKSMFQLGVFKLEMKKIPEKMSILSYIREHSSNQKDKNWRAYTKLLQEVLRDKDTETEASMLIAIDDLDKHGLYSNSDFFECIRKKWKFYVMFTTNDDRVTKEAVKIIDDPKGKTRIAHIEISLNQVHQDDLYGIALGFLKYHRDDEMSLQMYNEKILKLIGTNKEEKGKLKRLLEDLVIELNLADYNNINFMRFYTDSLDRLAKKLLAYSQITVSFA